MFVKFFRVVLEMGNKVLSLVARFPWIQMQYAQFLTLKSTVLILGNKVKSRFIVLSWHDVIV